MKIKILCLVAVGMLLSACETTAPTKGYGEGWEGGHRTLDKFEGPVPGSAEDFKQNIENKVYFDLNQYNLKDENAATLDKLADWLQNYPAVNIVIEGHCDKRGPREYNLALGEKRSNAVKQYLISKGIDEKRLSIVSYGKENLQAEGDTEEAHAKNRVSISVFE